MQLSNFKDLLISYCEVKKLNYEASDHELSITMDDAINHGKMTELCDSWYSDHENNRMVFKYNTGLVYTISDSEVATYNEIAANMPVALITAKYGVKKIALVGKQQYITFISPEDALNMSFLLINTAMDFDDVTG